MARLQQGWTGLLHALTRFQYSDHTMPARRVRYQYGSTASTAKPGLTHDNFVLVQTFPVGSRHHVGGVVARKVQEICPGYTVLDSLSILSLPCWTLIRTWFSAVCAPSFLCNFTGFLHGLTRCQYNHNAVYVVSGISTVPWSARLNWDYHTRNLCMCELSLSSWCGATCSLFTIGGLCL